MNTMAVGPKESEARNLYTTGAVAWDAVLAAREEDASAARADAEREAREKAAREAAEEAARAKAQAEHEARAAAEKERLEAPLRKRLAELRTEVGTSTITPKDTEVLVRAAMAAHAVEGRVASEDERRAKLYAELREIRAELGARELPVDTFSGASVDFRVDAVKTIVRTALASRSWSEVVRSLFENDVHGRRGPLAGTPVTPADVRSVLEGLQKAGGPALLPRELDAKQRAALTKARAGTREANEAQEAARQALYRAEQERINVDATANRMTSSEAREHLHAAVERAQLAASEEKRLRDDLRAKNVDVAAFDAGEVSP